MGFGESQLWQAQAILSTTLPISRCSYILSTNRGISHQRTWLNTSKTRWQLIFLFVAKDDARRELDRYGTVSRRASFSAVTPSESTCPFCIRPRRMIDLWMCPMGLRSREWTQLEVVPGRHLRHLQPIENQQVSNPRYVNGFDANISHWPIFVIECTASTS